MQVPTLSKWFCHHVKNSPRFSVHYCLLRVISPNTSFHSSGVHRISEILSAEGSGNLILLPYVDRIMGPSHHVNCIRIIIGLIHHQLLINMKCKKKGGMLKLCASSVALFTVAIIVIPQYNGNNSPKKLLSYSAMLITQMHATKRN